MPNIHCLKIAVVLFAALVANVRVVAQNPEAVEARVARAVADYLVAGRGAIAQQQGLINDAAKAEKGFTPAVYEQLMIKLLKEKGIDLARFLVDGSVKATTSSDPVDRALLQIRHAAKQVVAEAQDKINTAGVAYKGFTLPSAARELRTSSIRSARSV